MMPPTAASRLIEIDRALRLPGGLRELIDRNPDAAGWLEWVAGSLQHQTCGALEELHEDQRLTETGWVDESLPLADDPLPPLCLLDPAGREVIATSMAGIWRFEILPPTTPSDGGRWVCQLTTQDRTLLGSFDVSSVWGTPPQTGVWRLAAAPPETPPEVPPETPPETSSTARPEDTSQVPREHPSGRGSAPQPPEGEDGNDSPRFEDPRVEPSDRFNHPPKPTKDSPGLVAQWVVPAWALDVRLHRVDRTVWLDVSTYEGGEA